MEHSERVFTPVIPAATEATPLPFSPGTAVDGWIFVSGQGSVDLAGRIVRDSFEGEMRRSMENLERVLAEAGCSLADVVQVRAYLGDSSDVAEFNLLYREYFAPPYPARTTLSNCLGTLKFEIDVMARRPS